ncbi:hypothetical protein BH09SUM1_BH09SUM1_03590 [soil metagenome]
MNTPIVNLHGKLSNARKALRTTAIIMMATLAIPTAMTGCAKLFHPGGEKFVIPKADDAHDQADIAQQQYRAAAQSVDGEVKKKEFRKAVAALTEVEKNFPQDKVYTPPCRLLKADVLYKLEDYGAAERQYRDVITAYPDIPDVHSGALYGLGEALTKDGHAREGKEAYRQLLDTYKTSTDSAVKERVKRAEVKYKQIV